MRTIGAFCLCESLRLTLRPLRFWDSFYRRERKLPAKERKGVLIEFRKSHRYPIRKLLPLLVLLLLLSAIVFPTTAAFRQGTAATPSRIETNYDSVKDKTTVRLLPVRISGERDKYYSLHMSPSFSYPGHKHQRPSIIDFELQTVVKGRLRTDLYVVFIIDGETIFLSSSRWGIKRPVPGRLWMGERLVFRMPYETLVKIAKAQALEIKMDRVTFPVAEAELQALRDFAKLTESPPNTASTPAR